jgi:hypothetical protein
MHTRAVLLTGTALWFVAFVVLLPFWNWLGAHDHRIWLWTCLAGWLLGLVGFAIYRKHRGEGRVADSVVSQLCPVSEVCLLPAAPGSTPAALSSPVIGYRFLSACGSPTITASAKRLEHRTLGGTDLDRVVSNTTRRFCGSGRLDAPQPWPSVTTCRRPGELVGAYAERAAQGAGQLDQEAACCAAAGRVGGHARGRAVHALRPAVGSLVTTEWRAPAADGRGPWPPLDGWRVDRSSPDAV